MPLPSLRALYLKDCDVQSLEFLKLFIEGRERAGRPLKLLSMTPFPGSKKDATWFDENVFQFEYTKALEKS